MRLNPRWVPSSLHGRLLVLLMATLGALLAFNLWSDYRAAGEYTQEAYDQALADTAVALAAHVQTRDQRLSFDLPLEAALTLSSNRLDDMYYLVQAGDGTVVAGNQDLPSALSAPSPPGPSPGFFDGRYRGKPVRIVVYRSPTPLGEVTVKVAETTRRRDQLTRRFVSQDMLLDMLLVAATLVLVLVGVRLGLRPLARLRADLEQRSPGDLRALQEAGVPSEVRPLVQALNRQLKLLRSASEAQQNFLANAAHQLRTPLAGLQTQLEVTAQEHDPKRVRDGLNKLLDAVRRTAHLANQLLTLARAQPPASLTQGMQSVDLSDVMADSASLFFDRAVANDIELEFETTPAPLRASKWLIRELATNLIENALLYTPRGGHVTVRCGLKGEKPFLEVEDSGPGIPQAERERVFKRFYRMPNSTGEGSGLGLAIVNEIARAHAATIALTEPAAGGTRFTVTFQPVS
jgi:two-component system, OmpR family, sensor histidine kinase TctE